MLKLDRTYIQQDVMSSEPGEEIGTGRFPISYQAWSDCNEERFGFTLRAPAPGVLGSVGLQSIRDRVTKA